MKIADGNVVFNSSAEYSKIVADKLLAGTGYSIDDIDYFITSDQSTKIWKRN
jgi:3-oxoacyl-[acyl-carrier-protein] synthase-3